MDIIGRILSTLSYLGVGAFTAHINLEKSQVLILLAFMVLNTLGTFMQKD